MFNYSDYLEDLEEVRYRKPRKQPKRSREEVVAQLIEQGDDTREGFNPSFHASRHERQWILTYLGGFYEDHVITDVLRQVKGGKEANVYCCQAHPAIGEELIAAKVYRPRMFRNLKNDSLYRQGKGVLDTEGKQTRGRREALAMQQKSRLGQTLRHLAWLSNEFQTLTTLHAAGADVPRPFAQSDNAILMEYIGEELWPAPALINVTLPAEEAQPLFNRIIENIVIMLAHDLVHGDLSAHNILYWDGGVKIIDFPQAVNPYVNSDAYALLERDVTRICQYFTRYGINASPVELTKEVWERAIPT